MQTRALLRIRYLAARGAGMAALLAGVSALLFAVMHMAPGGPEAMLVGVSFPSFWLGILLILCFSSLLGWLPGAGFAPYGLEDDPWERIRHAILPTITLAVTQFAALARFTRSSMLDVLRRDYIRTAEAKGVGRRRVLYRHALRNGLIPVVTGIGLSLPALIGGAVLTETVFSSPGLGRLAVDAILERDYPVIMGIEMVVAAAVILANFLTDVVYTVVDPRISLE